MPRQIQVYGAYGYTPTKEQIQRLQTFLRWLPTKNAPTEVVIVPPEKMKEVSKIYSPNVDTNVGLTVGNRSYVSAKLFDAKDDFVKDELPNAKFPKGSALEWTLAHESSHLSDPTSHEIQERQDNVYNDAANAVINDWSGKKAQAYRATQANSYSAEGQYQPTPAPIQMQLVAPNVRTLTAPPDRVASIMSQKPQSTYVQSVTASSPNKGK